MRRVWVILLVVCALLVVGCDNNQTKKESENTKSETKVESKKKSGTYKYKNEKSEGQAEVGEDVDLPDDFPKDVPIYKNARITAAINNKSDQAEMTAVTLESKHSFKQVGQYYEKQLKASGYEIEGVYSTSKSMTINTKKGNTSVVVASTDQDGKTIAGLNITTRN